MRKITSFFAALLFTILAVSIIPASPAQAGNASAAQTSVTVGKMLYASDGKALGAVYSVDQNGSPQVMVDDQLVTVPLSTVSVVNGKQETSLTKSAVFASR